MTDGDDLDPVRARRAHFARLAALGKRIGYSLFGIAIVAFVIGFVAGFDGLTGTVVIWSIVIGSLVLAPAIVFAYGVKAADRDDRQRGL